MSYVDNQYRFYLESQTRINIKYDIIDDNIVFNDNKLTSSNLNHLIVIALNASDQDDINDLTFGEGNLEANIKFKIQCVGYFNNDNHNDKILPEAFIKHIQNPSSQELFAHIDDTYDIESNLLINGELNVQDDITAFATYHTSDSNLKYNINNLSNCYDIIDNLNPVTFNWSNNNKDDIGFIAQEVEQILPEIVNQKNNNKVLAYSKIIPYLVGSIQELDKELKELENNKVL